MSAEIDPAQVFPVLEPPNHNAERALDMDRNASYLAKQVVAPDNTGPRDHYENIPMCEVVQHLLRLRLDHERSFESLGGAFAMNDEDHNVRWRSSG